MDDLTILHLSDLHFDDVGAQPFKLYERLLFDIEEQLRYTKNVVIVVTGDLVEKAQYSCKVLVLEFFEKLRDMIYNQKIKIQSVLIVPGNHDKHRSYKVSLLPDNLTDLNDEFFKAYSSVIADSYKDYIYLRNEILNIFNVNFLDEKYRQSTFYLNSIIIANQKYNFICLDTSWSSKGDNDKRNLKIGKFQIDFLNKEFKKNSKKRNDITLVLAHHPLNWFTGDEEDYIRNFLIGQKGVDANVFLCGHTHQRDIINWSNNCHTLITLSTGIGWSDRFESDHFESHSYAIYVLHPSMNSIDVYVRSTNDVGKFVPDFRIYTREDSQKYNKIVLPIWMEEVQTYFELGRLNNRSPHVLSLSAEIVSQTREFVKLIEKTTRYASELTMKEYINVQKLFYGLDFTTKSERHKVINEYKFGSFSMFLQSVCEYLAIGVFGLFNIREEEMVGFHIRYSNFKISKSNVNADSIVYKQLCMSVKAERDDISLALSNKPLSDRKWGELLKDSFEAKRPLIYSLNQENVLKETEWFDFITAIPNFLENNFICTNSEGVEQYRPYITFGISISDKRLENILYCFDYYRIDIVLGNFINRFLHTMSIDIKKFIMYCIKLEKRC